MRILITMMMAAAGLSMPLTATAQWNTDDTPRCVVDASGQSENYARASQARRTADGRTWLYWMTWGRKQIGDNSYTAVRTYVQLLDADGCAVFDEPILVNDHATPMWWSDHKLCVASDGSAIVTVADSRCDEPSLEAGGKPSGFQAAIYKIDQEGNFLWGLDGITYPQFTGTPTTDAYVVGDDTYFIFKTSDTKYIQRISADGDEAWAEPRLWESESLNMQIIPSADDDLLLFDDGPDGARVHRLNRDLEEVWASASGEKGFVAMLEGSCIDDWLHANRIDLAMEETLDFDRTIGDVLQWAETDGHTLVIVTADHSTGALTLQDGNIAEGRIGVEFGNESHNGLAVPFFVWGPGSDAFGGILENCELSNIISSFIK